MGAEVVTRWRPALIGAKFGSVAVVVAAVIVVIVVVVVVVVLAVVVVVVVVDVEVELQVVVVVVRAVGVSQVVAELFRNVFAVFESRKP